MGVVGQARVIVRAGRRNPRFRMDGEKELITSIETGNTAGVALPPFIIYKGGRHFFGWHAGVNGKEDKDVRFAWSPNGWTDNELGMHYLIDHFIPLASKISNRKFPLFFILDGHVSHMNWRFLSYCLKSKIHVRSLPPHSTHLLQPLDVGVFAALQKSYAKEVDAYT